ncbi:MAG: 2-amino-4-hydroxy-6-hydroxymethyldihydropteridine diphosphokinase [Actinomycetota bacterium]|jgi:2-amino-4-hydroxy-6-hydroxymethyldihydropteridine diphosphokinase
MRAYLALGSNMGDREQYLRDAIRALHPLGIDASSVWETDPVGGPEGQGAFLNMVVALDTDKSPRELLNLAHSLEDAAGRVRTEHWGPRTLDVDVVMVGDLVVDEPDLVVPHPLWRERAFVVEPLREVADLALLPTLPDDLDTSGIRRVRGLWGEWDLSLRPADAVGWMDGWRGPWAVAGGWAIELFVGRPVREHHDMDVAVARADADRLHEQLAGWELYFPSPTAFVRWPGGSPLPDDEHQLWCKRDGVWTHEILFEDIRDGVLHYRRDPSITIPVDEAFLRTGDGIPYIAAHLQLLYKAKARTQRDQIDVAAAAPLMSPTQREFLAAYLRRRDPSHPWLALLD